MKTHLCKISGIGKSYWQVILGRTLTGCGASGIISLATIIITGKECLILDSYFIIISRCQMPSILTVDSCQTL